MLIRRGFNLLDPESIKDGIARQELWCEGRKANAVNVYTAFLRIWNVNGIRQHTSDREVTVHFYRNRARSTRSWMWKEDCWVPTDVERHWGKVWRGLEIKMDRYRLPEQDCNGYTRKRSNPRQFRVSHKLLAMLNALPREDERLWKAKLKTIRRTFQYARARIAEVTKNPRLRRITFHTFRHWKTTMKYHKTKDILHVMRMLGHRNINNTLRYTQIIETQDDEFISKVAKTVEEARVLVEAGYEYITEFRDQGIKIFRKRK